MNRLEWDDWKGKINLAIGTDASLRHYASLTEEERSAHIKAFSERENPSGDHKLDETKIRDDAPVKGMAPTEGNDSPE